MNTFLSVSTLLIKIIRRRYIVLKFSHIHQSRKLLHLYLRAKIHITVYRVIPTTVFTLNGWKLMQVLGYLMKTCALYSTTRSIGDEKLIFVLIYQISIDFAGKLCVVWWHGKLTRCYWVLDSLIIISCVRITKLNCCFVILNFTAYDYEKLLRFSYVNTQWAFLFECIFLREICLHLEIFFWITEPIP